MMIYSQYQQHKRKLTQIYESRKSHLGLNNQRNHNFMQLKQNKTKSFINKFNQKSSTIASDNLKLLGKLERVKTSINCRSTSESRQRSLSATASNPLLKRKKFQTEKQNMRMSNRMRNIPSTLQQKSLMKDYAKSQKIKNRLMKYTQQSDKVSLKSDRYFDGERSMLKSPSNSNQNRIILNKPKNKKNETTFSHYKGSEIRRNRIDTSTSSLSKIKLKNLRPNTSFDAKNMQTGTFFATQPRKVCLHISKQKNI